LLIVDSTEPNPDKPHKGVQKSLLQTYQFKLVKQILEASNTAEMPKFLLGVSLRHKNIYFPVSASKSP
jgi:hypothetical protein